MVLASLTLPAAGAGSGAMLVAAQARHAPGTIGASAVSGTAGVVEVLEDLPIRLIASIKRHIVCLSSLSIGGVAA